MISPESLPGGSMSTRIRRQGGRSGWPPARRTWINPCAARCAQVWQLTRIQHGWQQRPAPVRALHLNHLTLLHAGACNRAGGQGKRGPSERCSAGTGMCTLFPGVACATAISAHRQAVPPPAAARAADYSLAFQPAPMLCHSARPCASTVRGQPG